MKEKEGLGEGGVMKKTKASTKKAKKITKPMAKKLTAKTKKKPAKKAKSVSKKKTLKPRRTEVKSKKTGLKARKSKPKKSSQSSFKSQTPAKPIFKKNPNGMNHFQQCVVLAALINQKRRANQAFQSIPLPEITSPLLASLREYLGQYTFSSEDIQNGLDDLAHADIFVKTFPVKDADVPVECTVYGNPQKMMAQLLDLAGPEARKIIFLKDDGNRLSIHRTTLEKYALKTGQIESHPLHHDMPNFMSHESTHREILHQINQRTNPKYFGQEHPQNFSTKQRRGRG